MSNFIIYDLETSDSHLQFSQILEASFIVCDENLVELDRANFYARLSRTFVPNPGALITNQVSVKRLKETNSSEYEMTKQIISLSENAAKRIKEIMSKAEKNSVGVRVGVKSGGCAGMSYIMEYAKDIKPNEEIVEDKGVKVLIDPKAIMYLLGTEMDYKTDKFSSQFVFKNPNETERCGCGESFKV